MRNSTLLIAGGGGAVAIVLVGLVIAVRRDAGSRPRPPQVPVASAAPVPAATQPPPAPALPVEAAKPIAAGAAKTIRPDDASTIADLDRAHPGIADAYRTGREAAMPDLQRRQQRRCLRRFAPELTAIEWTTLETYAVDGAGRAVLSAFDQLPGTPGIQAFLDCIHRDMVGSVTFAVPQGTPSTFTIRETSRLAAERRREPD